MGSGRDFLSAGTRSGALRAITLSGSAYWLLKSFEGRNFTLSKDSTKDDNGKKDNDKKRQQQ